MFQVEPDSFGSFFDAIYWAVVTLTTVGYGDIYPISDMGRVVSMLSSFMGMAVVALPTGIISAGYMNELNNEKKANKKP
jgi:voltage-gated potassium channel